MSRGVRGGRASQLRDAASGNGTEFDMEVSASTYELDNEATRW